MGLRKSFLRNIGSGAIARVVQLFIGLVIIAYVIETVGMEQWGILTVSVSFVSLLSLIQVSLSSATGKRLTDFLVKKNHDEYKRYLAGTLVITLIINLIIAVFILVGYFFLQSFTTGHIDNLRVVYILTGVNAIIHVVQLPAAAILQSINRVDIKSNSVIGGFLIRTCFVFTFFVIYKSIISYAAILLIEGAINMLVLYFFALKKVPLKLNASHFKLTYTYLLEIVKFNFYNFINSLNYLLFLQIPALIIARRFGLEMSGYYGVALQLNNVIRGVANIFMSAMAPLYNIINARGEDKQIKDIFIISSKIFFLFGAGIIIFSQFLLADFVSYFLDIGTEDLNVFLRTFSVFIAIGIIFIPSALILITLEKLKRPAIFGFMCSIFAFVSLYVIPGNSRLTVLIPVVLSTFFLLYNFYRFWLTKTILKLKTQNLKQNIVNVLLVGLVVFLINFDISLNFFIKTSISISLFTGVVALLIDKNELIYLKSLVKK